MNQKEPVLCMKRIVRLHNIDTGKELIKIGGRFTRQTHRRTVEERDTNQRVSELLYPFRFKHTLEENRLVLKRRGDVEENGDYKQLTVGLYITNKSNTRAIVLRRHNRHDLTLIQGHVSVPECNGEIAEDYMSKATLYNNLRWNLEKEATEEVNGLREILNSKYASRIKLRYFMNNDFSPNLVSYYHIGFIFVWELPDSIFDVLSRVVSTGEPTKHEIEVIDTEICDKETMNIDSWLYEVIQDYTNKKS